MTSAIKALTCLDLTNLEEECTETDIVRLCERAVTTYGHVAAICIWPRFVKLGVQSLKQRPVRIATVVNFPGGDQALDVTIAETEQALGDGADEIDLVIPYRSIVSKPKAVSNYIAAVRKTASNATLKAILETGELKDAALIRQASDLALEAGADFLKTSTGKVGVNATPEAARIMLEAICDHGGTAGFKAAGGIRTPSVAAAYLELAGEIMGKDWAGPETFRFGASGLLDVLLADLAGRAAVAGDGY